MIKIIMQTLIVSTMYVCVDKYLFELQHFHE